MTALLLPHSVGVRPMFVGVYGHPFLWVRTWNSPDHGSQVFRCTHHHFTTLTLFIPSKGLSTSWLAGLDTCINPGGPFPEPSDTGDPQLAPHSFSIYLKCLIGYNILHL